MTDAVDLDHVPDPVGLRLDEALATGPDVAASAAWHHASHPDTVTTLASSAALAHDAHRVKYVLASFDAAAADPSHRPLYLAAAAYLEAWWVQHPEPG